MKQQFLMTILIFLSIACNPQRQKEIIEAQTQRDRLYDEVMAVHDEVMPHMRDIRRYKEQIRDKIQSMAREGVTDQREIQVLNNLIDQLESADDAMMGWMRAFGGRDIAQLDDEASIKYLEEQKQEIEKVKKEMETALSNAREALR
jgi:DNA-binding ferritin-like protein (Dps family)